MFRRLQNIWHNSQYRLSDRNGELTITRTHHPKPQLATVMDFTQPDNPLERELK